LKAESKGDISKMVQLQGAIKFNGGGGSLGLDLDYDHITTPVNQPPMRRSCQSFHILDKFDRTKG
jgi:hypothetical protein